MMQRLNPIVVPDPPREELVLNTIEEPEVVEKPASKTKKEDDNV